MQVNEMVVGNTPGMKCEMEVRKPGQNRQRSGVSARVEIIMHSRWRGKRGQGKSQKRLHIIALRPNNL
jgi:hypothetical protein